MTNREAIEILTNEYYRHANCRACKLFEKYEEDQDNA